MMRIQTPMVAFVAVGVIGCGVEQQDGVDDPALNPTLSQPTQTGYALSVSGESSNDACLFDLEPVVGWSYQTPKAAQMGVAAVELLRSADDANAHRLVEHSPAHSADLVEGATFVEVDTGSIPEGTYTHMRVKLDHIAFEVDATGHMAGFALPGELVVDYALSDHDNNELGTRTQGEYLAEFAAAGMTVPQAGVRLVEYPPSYPEATVTTAGGEYWVTFLVPGNPIIISHAHPEQVDVGVQFCIEDGFAWAENENAGHTEGTFDLDYHPMTTEQPMSMAVRGFTMAVN